MFTVKQIQQAHRKVKSGADFPNYIQEIKQLGVTGYDTWVKDGHSDYHGDNGFSISSAPEYDELFIADESGTEQFKLYLRVHQQGQTDYLTFCNNAAESGVEKWTMDLNAMTCTYYDKKGNEMLKEKVPG